MSNIAPETKLIKALRTILSFILAINVSVLSIAMCFSISFLNPSNVEKHFTSVEYVNGLRQNLIDYVDSFYIKSGFDYDNVDKIITKSAVSEIADNYAGCYISNRVGYEENAYVDSIDKLVGELEDDIAKQIEKTKQHSNKVAIDNSVKAFTEYFKGEVAIKGSDKLATVFNIGKPASLVLIGVSIFFFIFIVLILYFLGERKHRSLRAISISFMTSGLFNICLSLIVLIISKIKRFDIFPIYLYNEFIKYFYTCVGIAAASGFACIVLSLCIAAVVWKMKSKG